MTMMRDVLPYLVQAGGELAKELAIGYVREQFSTRMTLRTAPVTAAAVKDPHGCPFCAISRSLAPVYFYMKRAPKSPRFGAIYVQLAGKQVNEALAIVDAIPGEPDAPTMRLAAQLVALDVMLSRPGSAPDYGAIAAAVDDLMDFDMVLAERFNSSAGTGDALAAHIEERLARLDAIGLAPVPDPVLEGEFRVVP